MSLLPPNETESELSYAYLHAVAAAAGMSCEVSPRHADNMGIDATVRASEKFADDSLLTDFALSVQLKATIKEMTLTNEKISYFVDGVARYDRLRKKTIAPPMILVVLFLPRDPKEWLKWSEVELAMRKCAWWVSLRGAAGTENESGKTVYLPRNQFFNSNGLRDIMTRLSQEEDLNYAG